MTPGSLSMVEGVHQTALDAGWAAGPKKQQAVKKREEISPPGVFFKHPACPAHADFDH